MVFNAFPLRAIIENYLLQVTLESLSEAEWRTRPERTNEDTFDKTTTIKITTPVGNVEIKVHDDRGTPFHSKLLRGRKRELFTPVASLLQLSFCEGSALETALKGIYQEDLPESFVSFFSTAMSNQLQHTQTAALPSDWDTLYFGSLSFDEQDAETSSRALDYCVGVGEENERTVLGLWDPGKRWLSRWREIRLELERRGLRKARGVITDNSPGLADVLLELLPPGQEVEIPVIEEQVYQEIEQVVPEKVEIVETMPLVEEDLEIDLFESDETEDLPQPEVAVVRHSSMNALVSICAVLILVLAGGFYYSVLGRSVDQTSVTEPQAHIAHSNYDIQLLEQQKSEMIERRLLAELVDAALPPETLAAVVESASIDENPSVRGAVIRLGSHPNSNVRISVAKALSAFGVAQLPDAHTELLRLLNDDDFLVRGFAAKGLARIKSKQSIEALRQRLHVEKDEQIRLILLKYIPHTAETKAQFVY